MVKYESLVSYEKEATVPGEGYWIEPNNIATGLRSQRDALRIMIRSRINVPLELKLAVDQLTKIGEDIQEYADDCRKGKRSTTVLISTTQTAEVERRAPSDSILETVEREGPFEGKILE